MYRILITACLFFFTLLSCKDSGNGEIRLPRPGETHLRQVYMLVAGNDSPGADDWLTQSLRSFDFKKGIGASFHFSSVTNTVEAEKILRDWNARPVDLLILGPGLPSRVFFSLKLAKNPKRKLIVLSPEVDLPFGSSISVDEKDISSFFAQICEKLKKPCGFPGKMEGVKEFAWLFQYSPPTKATHVSRHYVVVDVAWRELFNDFEKLESSGNISLNFSSGYLQLKELSRSSNLGPQFQKESKEFEELRAQLILQKLTE